MRRAPWQATEEALSLINRSYADWDRIDDLVPTRPRLGVAALAMVAHDPRAVSIQAVYARLISIAEAYTDIVIEGLFGREFPNPGPVLGKLIEDALDSSSLRWEDRKGALKLHAAPVSDFQQWSQFDAAIDVRNSIMHGLGSLTRRQRKDSKIVRKLGTLGISVQGGRLLVRGAHVSRCRELCVEYVRWLDGTCGF
jgi:hypothetical protein